MSHTIYSIDTTARYVDAWGEEACEGSCYIEVSCEPYNDGFLYDVDVCDPSGGFRTSQFTSRKDAERKVGFLLGLMGRRAVAKFAGEMERGEKETCCVEFRERGVLKHETVQRVVYTCGDARYIKWRGWWREVDGDNMAWL